MSAEDFLKKFSEENGDLFYTENNNDVFDGSAGTVLRAMKEFAKQEAVDFFKWNAKKISDYLMYLSEVHEDGINEKERELYFFETATVETRFEIYKEEKP